MAPTFDVVCLSHLRWDFVFQRPHHLLSRYARDRRVFFIEEPEFGTETLDLRLYERGGVTVAVPQLPANVSPGAAEAFQRALLDGLFDRFGIADHVLWYYTPMAMAFSRHLQPQAVVYDCMDELSAFRFAPPELLRRETELLARADLVFTGGRSLYEAKRARHPRVYPFPSSVDVPHFARARGRVDEPEDQAAIPGPRLGFFGVIDERMDLELIDAVAARRPEWQIVLLGPVVKIDPADLPRRPNLHYLGGKPYEQLPNYVAGWDVALLPFARNEATRYISPTKTPEYLAAGRSVVSTSIRDVVQPYGDAGLVRIADTVDEFVAATEAALSDDVAEHRRRADAVLADMSWERTWAQMAALVEAAVAWRRARSTRRTAVPSTASGAETFVPAAGDA